MLSFPLHDKLRDITKNEANIVSSKVVQLICIIFKKKTEYFSMVEKNRVLQRSKLFARQFGSAPYDRIIFTTDKSSRLLLHEQVALRRR